MQYSKSKSICVIGAGEWGKNHIKTLNEIGCLGGIVESNYERLTSLSDEFPFTKTYSDIEEALKDGYDGYVAATPAKTHFQIGSMLLKHGRNVLIEKPMALCSEDSLELVKLSKKTGSKLMTGHLLLFHPAIEKMKEIIDTGRIGKLWYLYSNRLNMGKIRTDEDVFWSLAPHDVYLLNFLTGSSPVFINASGGHFLQDGIYDMIKADFIYPGKIKAHIFVSWLNPFKEHRLVVIGSRGMIVFEDSQPERKILFYNKRIDMVYGKPSIIDRGLEVVPYEYSPPLKNELKYFIEHLDSSVTIADGKSGHEMVEIIERIKNCLSY